ncbi:MAG: sulfate reduction electron transfer complex DsrMKJOP subunit DsrO [bacterium]
MSVDRRKFLKLAGLTTVLGFTGKASFEALADVPDAAPYRNPLTGKRWAMVIDLRKWTDEDAHTCKAACHREHNVPDIPDTEEEIKWFWVEEFEHSFPSQENLHLAKRLHDLEVPLLCNHCDNPPCTRVCPTQATWKRDKDGIVMMDWHRCIGCRFCIAACPYGSRSFNWRDPRPHIEGEMNPDFPTRQRGVVEKCTFCEERLARGEQPACVEARSSGALVFGDLEDSHSEVRHLLHENFTIRRKPGLGTQPEVYYIV